MKYFFTILSFLITGTVYCQTAEMYLISSAGGDFTTQNEQLSFTVGEVVTESFTKDNLFITQGFLQSEVSVVGVATSLEDKFSVNIYPNPAKDYFYINITSDKNIESDNYYDLSIIDINGSVIAKHSIYQDVEHINISNYLSGSYFIKITNKKGERVKVVLLNKL